MKNIVVWAADIGSIKTERFGWYRAEDKRYPGRGGTDINEFIEGIKDDMTKKKKVAIGFECPLFVPITDKPEDLTKAREGENNRPWSAGAGCGSLATGLTECVWIFERIRESNVDIKPSFSWKVFLSNESNFFIWESFVTSSSKGETHPIDAKKAVETFLDILEKYPDGIEKGNSVKAQNPYSLVGAGLLRAGLTTNLKLLSEPCIVIKS